MGMDLDPVWPVRRVRGFFLLPGIFGRLLSSRRPQRDPLRHEGGVASHRGPSGAAVVSELVPAALSAHLRDLPVRDDMTAKLLTSVIQPAALNEFAAEVRAGLKKAGQKELPSRYLYDEVGSALFDVITVLPEYGLTRADERLLGRHAVDIVSRLKSDVLVAELGSGSGRKTRWILAALTRRQRTTYCPIEISPTALARCGSELGQIEHVGFVGLDRPYLDGLLAAASWRREHEHLLVLFLGSTIGNFDRDAGERFLAGVRRILYPGDALLLGT